MPPDSRRIMHKENTRTSVPRNLSISKCWNIIGPYVAKEISASDYLPIPHYLDMNAYRIKCFRHIAHLSIIGPLRDFVSRAKTDSTWFDEDFHAIKSGGDRVDFRITLEHGKDQMTFTGRNYYFLSKAEDMRAEGNVTIDRSSHEDLACAKWFGLITSVVVGEILELHVTKDLRSRTMYIGDGPHTLLFKYEICEMDEGGHVRRTTVKKLPSKWAPMRQDELESFPLPEFKSQSARAQR
ncbi:hypothetical protein KM043_008336 [Ampulex compressa]|nr:hypothetical protein KM043_008336 [Ampulex compressa]